MKKSEREIFMVLAAEVDAGLGAFCKHADYAGSDCCETYFVCEHPLREKLPISEDCECCFPNTDCWGFQPSVKVVDVADIVGIILSEQFLDWSWRYDILAGRILVSGRRKRVDRLPEPSLA